MCSKGLVPTLAGNLEHWSVAHTDTLNHEVSFDVLSSVKAIVNCEVQRF